MKTIKKIESQQIVAALQGLTRQYLVGNLQRPQILQHLFSSDVEIGISSYKNYTEELPHNHTHATEYQYIISGWTKYLDIESMEEYEFKTGDFYQIEPGTSYAQKSKSGTKILFIKVPSINDKVCIPVTHEVQKWYDEGLKTIRKDYANDSNMPAANSIRPGAAVVIYHDNKILLLKRKDNQKWTLPGGTLEMNESLIQCAVREVEEECGLHVSITDTIGIYSNPNIRIEYSDGEVRREFTVVFFGIVNDAQVIMDHESSAYRWVTINETDQLPMAESQRARISDVKEYIINRKKQFR